MFKRPYLTIPALVGALLGAGVAAHAQTAPSTAVPAFGSPVGSDGATRPHKAGRMTLALRSLDLSSTQKAQIKAARHSYRSSRSSATPETRAQLRTQIENILTPSQRTRFDAAMQRRRDTSLSR